MEAKIWQKRSIIALVATICGLLWGSAFPVLKISYQELQMAPDDIYAKMVFAGVRFFLAGVMILVFTRIRHNSSLLSEIKGFKKAIFGMGIIGTTLQYFFFYNGLAHTTGVTSSIIVGLGTFLVAIMAHFYYPDDGLTKRKIAGLTLGMIGVASVALLKGPLEFHIQWNGEGFLLISVTVSSIAAIYGKELGKKMNILVMTGSQMCVGAAILLVGGLMGIQAASIQWTALGLGLLLYASLLSAVAFGLWYTLLVFNKAGEISLYKFLIPIFGSVLSAIFLKEQFTYIHGGALILVVLGIWMVNGNGMKGRVRDETSA
jgi:drug/metabolite transporter (DMT)-like permease